MADYVLHVQREIDRSLVLKPAAVVQPIDNPRAEVKYQHTWKTVAKFILKSFIFGGIQSPKIYFFVTVPLVVVLGPLLSSVFLAADSIYHVGEEICEFTRLNKIKQEIAESGLPEDIKKLAFEKIDQQKKEIGLNLLSTLGILGLRLAAVVATALVIASVSLAPYAIPIISGLGVGAVILAYVIKAVIGLIRRPNSCIETISKIKLTWNQICSWVQEAKFNYDKRSFIAKIGKLSPEEIEAGKVSLQAKIDGYRARKNKSKELKHKILNAQANDFELVRAQNPSSRSTKNGSDEVLFAKNVIEETCSKELSKNEEKALLKFFQVNPAKFYDAEHGAVHLEKKVKEFFATSSTVTFVDKSKDLYMRWKGKPVPPSMTSKLVAKVKGVFNSAGDLIKTATQRDPSAEKLPGVSTAAPVA